MTDPITPCDVEVRKAQDRNTLIDHTIKVINEYLVKVPPFPNGRWDVRALVPEEIARSIADRYKAKGWVVAYSYDPDAYSNYFTIGPK